MVKVASPSAWNFQEQTTAHIKFSSAGLVGDDLRSFLKRSSAAFADEIKHLELHPDEIPVHLIAIGATEAYGPNRNGDGFKEAACRDFHHTFVKDAYNYKNHKNRDPRKSYGRIKASCYNEDMRRIELLLTFNSTQKAADFNRGLVAEDWVLQKLARNEDVPFSMACKVAYDVCASCGNKARHRGEYCTDDTCVGPLGEKRGGCRHNLTKLAEDGFINHVDNPGPGFFDMSHLSNVPADRIAYGGVARYMQKAASGEVPGGAALAEAWGLGFELLPLFESKIASQTKLAYQLAAAEAAFSADQRNHALSYAYTGSEVPSWFEQAKLAQVLKSLAQAKALLPLEMFLAGEGKEAYQRDVAARLPGVYTRMADSEQLDTMLVNNVGLREVQTSAALRDWAKQARHSSLVFDVVCQQATQQSLHRPQPALAKVASLPLRCDDAERLAWKFALYNLAILDNIDHLTDDMLELAVLQNFSRAAE